MKCSFEKIMKDIDWVVIPIGILALILSLFGVDCKCLTILAGFLGLLYFAYAIYLWLHEPKFDWHLIRGKFLFKVIAFVLLTPFSITSGFMLFNTYSPKNLIYEEKLYTANDINTDTLGIANGSFLSDTIFVKTHNINLAKDSIVTRINKLKDPGITKQNSPSIFWTVYYHFIDSGNQHMTTSQSGRGWSALIAILGVFLLNGLLVSSIIGYIDRRKEKWLKGEVKYSRFLRRKKHYVIIGGNDMVAGIVRQIISKGKYILIQTSNDVENFRRSLFSNLTEEQQKLIIIYYGNRTSKEDIDTLCIENAEEVYIIGEEIRTDDIESYHDTMNMNCLKLISENIKNAEHFNKYNRLICRVMFEYQTSFNILQVTDIDGEKIDFKPFNYYETWAQKVLICQELQDVRNCEYLPLEGFDGIKSDEDVFVHLVVVGMSRMGLAMAIEAAHLAHYPNFDTNRKRTRITFIGTSMEQEKNFFMGRFKEMFSVTRHRYVAEATKWIYNDFRTYSWQNPLAYCDSNSLYCDDSCGDDFTDLEWEFINGSIENPNIQQYLADAAACKTAKLTIAVCIPENSRAIAAAAYLPDSVYKSASTLQVLVYQRLNNDLLSQINQNKRYHAKLRAFGMNSTCYNFEFVELSEFIAKRVNEAYNQYDWEKIQTRYKGKGLIDDDYDSLSNYLFSDESVDSHNKEYIKRECRKWMENNSHECHYKTIKDSLKDFQESLKASISKQNEHTENNAGKSKSAKMWSNQYNVYSMWTKFRCFGVNPTKQQDFDDSIMCELGKMEHNRWIVEQLLLRYRPLTKSEQQKAQITDLYSSAKQKGLYKKEFAHLDICSNDKLAVVDYNMNKLDQVLIKVLPGAYREYLAEKEHISAPKKMIA